MKIVSSPGAPEPSRKPYLNSSSRPDRPMISGGVAPAEGLNGFSIMYQAYESL
ncbi:hypothetical protein ARZXY2_2564 [Arthrobacter sp. ZXY-2]|nr:hypothetical protein ARZXY2_2564 [Arthrobacter sp. ZXY-2]